MAGGIREPLLTCSSSFCKKVDKYTKPAEFKFAKTVPTLNRYTSLHKDLCETMNMCDFLYVRVGHVLICHCFGQFTQSGDFE